jgi:hypothetical protein
VASCTKSGGSYATPASGVRVWAEDRGPRNDSAKIAKIARGGAERGPLTEPVERSRPYVPGYGVPASGRGMLSWDHVEERMTVARNYWVSTVRSDGRPHLSPVWGVWVDGAFYFGSGPKTRKVRNLSENPHVALHPEGDDVVIVEGVAERITDPDPATSKAPMPCVHASCSPGPTSRAPRRAGYSTAPPDPAPQARLPVPQAKPAAKAGRRSYQTNF